MTVLTTGLPHGLSAPPAGSLSFPLGWLLDNAAPPLQYRATTDVANLTVPPDSPFHHLPYGFTPAITLAVTQAPNGTWGNSMLALPSARAEHFRGVGTVPAVRRLLEYGWDRESPPLLQARRVLFRLLAEDDDPAYAFELIPAKGGDPGAARRARSLLREAAAAALAHAGYEKDPRLRGAASRIVERIDTFLRSPLAQDPFVRVGNQRALAEEAAPPSVYALTMLAYMPLFRSERYEAMDRLGQYLAQPAPRTAPAIAVGRDLVPAPHLLLGDPLPGYSAAEADLPWALTWLELVARLGLLRRQGWGAIFERLRNECDADGVWHPRKGNAPPKGANPFSWPSFPLEPQLIGEARWTDVTFRLGLIGRLGGWQIDLV